MGESHIIIDQFLNTYHPIINYTSHKMFIQCSMVNPIYNIASNTFLNFVTNNPYGRCRLTLKSH